MEWQEGFVHSFALTSGALRCASRSYCSIVVFRAVSETQQHDERRVKTSEPDLSLAAGCPRNLLSRHVALFGHSEAIQVDVRLRFQACHAPTQAVRAISLSPKNPSSECTKRGFRIDRSCLTPQSAKSTPSYWTFYMNRIVGSGVIRRGSLSFTYFISQVQARFLMICTVFTPSI